ncbi:MAG: redoxin domain-containing protein [Verrucomicrobiales bacterium]|nr:redoxin domain-containing protein [Verrucomicrobiota bacterium JB025]
MNYLRILTLALSIILPASAIASPAETTRIRKSWELAMQNWQREMQLATTPESRADTIAKRPDTASYARQVWQQIAPSLSQDWTLDPAAWFLKVTPRLLTSTPQGGTTPTFANEIEALKKAVEKYHLKSPKLIPVCMALVATGDPGTLPILEKIESTNPDPKVQGVAALGAAMMLKSLGEEPEIMRKRLSYIRQAIIKSSDIQLTRGTVAEIAEDELYIIRYLTKGRVAPDLDGIDSAGRSFRLSDYAGKVILLLFWSNSTPDADHIIQLTTEMEKKFAGQPFVVIGVDRDPMTELRKLKADGTITWRNFSDPVGELANQYRVASYPLVYLLDGDRNIRYSGALGSFAELTAAAVLAEKQKP